MEIKGLLVYSGGMDSTTLLYDYRPFIDSVITFKYCSRQNPKEIACAKWHTKNLQIQHNIVKLDFFKDFNRFSLHSHPKIEGKYSEKTIKSGVVPFRNGIMIAIAIGIAEDRKLDVVFVAIHGAEHAIYLDCSEKFLNLINILSMTGTYKPIRVSAPYIHKNKREIALIGKALHINYSKTWSCYKGLKNQCGLCGTCIERKEALQGFDSTKYEGTIIELSKGEKSG